MKSSPEDQFTGALRQSNIGSPVDQSGKRFKMLFINKNRTNVIVKIILKIQHAKYFKARKN